MYKLCCAKSAFSRRKSSVPQRDALPPHRLSRGCRKLVKEERDYEGFVSRPMRWETVVRKFQLLTKSCTSDSLHQRIVESVADLERTQINRLADLLQKVRSPAQASEKGVLQCGPI